MTLSTCGAVSAGSAYPTDTLTTRDGQTLRITFYGHSSLAFNIGGRRIYVDPVGENADYRTQPCADLILITHAHGDHLDTAAIDLVEGPQTRIVANAASVEVLGRGTVLRNGEKTDAAGIRIEAVPAYNTTPGREQFHPHDGRDNGYLLTMGGTRVYVAGDSENTPEMKALRNIDIAFLPVNQPYTMTVDQAVDAVRAMRPALFYPYHTGQVDHPTDTEALGRALEGVTEVRLRPME